MLKEGKGTTIAVDIVTSKSLDLYCKRCGILKKDFVRVALEWFNDLDIDITSETRYKPEQDIKHEEMEQLPVVKQQMDGLYQLMANFISHATPNIDVITKNAEDMGIIKAQNEILRSQNEDFVMKIKELTAWKENAIKEFIRVQNEQKTFGKVKLSIPV